MIRRHKGFSLLEILVAFSIMAVALTIVLRIFGSGVNNAVISEEYTLAVQIAESLMAKVGVEIPWQAGEISGNEGDRYDWRVLINPVAKSGSATAGIENAQMQSNASVQLMSINVRVAWGNDDIAQRAIELNGLKTVTVQFEQP